MAETTADPDGERRASRREFLQAAGLGAAGLGVGGVVGGLAGYQAGLATGEEAPPLDPRSVPGFDHVVVFMGENRSFDNLLGWLYTPDDPPPGGAFEGLAFGQYANDAPDGTAVAVHVYEGDTDRVMQSPDPDPGEEYPHVNTQLFGRIDPADNRHGDIERMTAPWNAPGADTPPTMDGFIADYAVNLRRLHGREPATKDLEKIMGGFSPAQLPVLSTLARSFAVLDHWYAGVPSQTFCNRSFFHASTSHGFVTNQYGGGYRKWLDAPAAPTIFDRLEDAGLPWRIYFDELSIVSYTGMLHAPALERYWKTDRFATMDQFFIDAADGSLPAYAFIEPRLVYNHNDFHPPVGAIRVSDVDGIEVYDSAQSDVRAGEALVASIYDAIRTSSSATGSNALNTLLLITFDEHGGTYDHVAPPAASPPDDAGPGEMDFRFDRLGVRVPAIAVSAYTAAGTVIADELHHGSVIATLCRLHGLAPLTRRDEEANDLFGIVNVAAPRDPSTWPLVQPQWVPKNPEQEPAHPAHLNEDKPLTSPARGLLGLLIAKYDPGAPVPETFGDAYTALRKYGSGLFTTGSITPSPTPSPGAT